MQVIRNYLYTSLAPNSSMSRIRIKFYRFPPDQLLDILFREGWLLEIKYKRPRTNRLLIDIMQRCQIRMAECLINCEKPRKVLPTMKSTPNSAKKENINP
jgi:hypothetical protein